MKARFSILVTLSLILALLLVTGCDAQRPVEPLETPGGAPTNTPMIVVDTAKAMQSPGPTTPSGGTPIIPTAPPAGTPIIPTAPVQTPAATAAPGPVSPGPAQPVSPPAAGETVYVVQWGDTLSAIAWRYGTTVTAIAQRNGIVNTRLIYVGQRIIIPAGGTQPGPGGTRIHIVQRGESLWYIAQKYGTTVAAIAQANSIWNTRLIYAGQRLVIPGGDGQPGPGQRYVVQPGDTLSAIALRFGTTVMALAMANNLSNPSLIYPGQVLIVP